MNPIIIGVAAILILAGVVGGGLMVSGVLDGPDVSAEEALSSMESRGKKTEAPNDVIEPLYHEMARPLLTNVKGSRKMMQAKIALMTRDPDVVNLAIKHEYAIRAGVLELLGELTEEETISPTFRADLSIALRDSVNRTLEDVTGNGGVDEVLFTELVVQ